MKEIGLTQHPTSPYIFYGTLIANQPPIYVGMYVDDIIHFSQSRQVEEKFESDFKTKIDIEFNGRIGHFLGINFTCVTHQDNNISIHLSQEAFIESMATTAKLTNSHMTHPKTPYRSGYPVDKINSIHAPFENQNQMIVKTVIYMLTYT